MKKILSFILTLFLIFSSISFVATLSSCEYVPSDNPDINDGDINPEYPIDEDGIFNTKNEVALYLHTYNKLPSNYYPKSTFYDINHTWTADNKISCGGDRFYNYEGLLPKASSRIYFECDIDYRGGSRNAKRIVYSNDGLIFYTDDHYESFEQLYDGTN